MQPVKFLKFLRQLGVLIQRNLQLIWNDKLLLASLALQSPFMALVVKLTADPNCFTSNLVNIGSRTALFVLAAMATFMGTLNSYREICREREIILREASVGVSLPAVVLSKAAVLLLVEVLQAAILAFGFVSIVHVPQNHLLLETDMEIFITVLLTMFSSSCIGLLISVALGLGLAAVSILIILLPWQLCPLIGLVTLGIGSAPIYPCIIHATPQSFGRENSQAIIGVQMASAYIGSTFMPPLFGLIAQYGNIGFYPVYLMIFAVLMIVLYGLFTKGQGKKA